MKIKYTIFKIIITMFCAVFIQAQNPSIQVNLKPICEAKPLENYEISLWNIENTTPVLIQKIQGTVASFTNLNANHRYKIEINCLDKPLFPGSLVDMVQMQNHMLDVESLCIEGFLAAKMNNVNSLLLSTLDVVLFQSFVMRRDTSLIPSKVFLLEKWKGKKLNETGGNFQYNNQFIIDNFQSLTEERTFYVIDRGDVKSTIEKYCDQTCKIDTTTLAQIIVHDDSLLTDKKNVVPILMRTNQKITGYNFRLVLDSNIVAETVVPKPQITYYYDKVKNTITFIRIPNPGNSQKVINEKEVMNIADIVFQTSKNLQTQTAIVLDTVYNNHMVSLSEGGCVTTFTNFEDRYVFNQCKIKQPKDITISTCTFLDHPDIIFESGSCDYHVVNHQDTEIIPCGKILRKYTVLDFLSLEITYVFQNIFIDTNYHLVCEVSKDVLFDTPFISFEPEELLAHYDSTHIYSFSEINAADTTITLQLVAPFLEKIIVYDHTDSTYCIATVYKRSCQLEDIKPGVSDKITQRRYGGRFEIEAEDFLKEILFVCKEKLRFPRISYDGGAFQSLLIFDYNTYLGSTVELRLQYQYNGITYEHGMVEAELLGEIINDLVICSENIFLEKGKPREILFYSSNFVDVTAFQFELDARDAAFGTVKSLLSDPILFNPTSDFIKTSWLSFNAKGVTIPDNQPLFSVVITPEKDGMLADFISLEEILYIPLVVYDYIPGVLHEAKVILSFSKTTTSLDNDIKIPQFLVYPNPLTEDRFYIAVSDKYYPNEIRYTLTNKLGIPMLNGLLSETKTGIDVSGLSQGMYFLELTTGSTRKVLPVCIVNR